jgi:hypothetical protein
MAFKKLAPFSVSSAFQKTIIAAALAAFVVDVYSVVEPAITQLSTNPNLSAYYWMGTLLVIAPIVMFALMYVLGGKKNRFFSATLLTVVGMIVLHALGLLVERAANALSLTTGFWDWYAMNVITTVAGIAGYAYLVFSLKRSGKL